MSRSSLAGKPVALLGVASGRRGAVKALEHLRGVCCHLGAIPVPGAVSVAQVHRIFDAAGRWVDADVARLTVRLADALVTFARVLGSIESGPRRASERGSIAQGRA